MGTRWQRGPLRCRVRHATLLQPFIARLTDVCYRYRHDVPLPQATPPLEQLFKDAVRTNPYTLNPKPLARRPLCCVQSVSR
jgi:hypothetical protein